jgi:hypothetical protein
MTGRSPSGRAGRPTAQAAKRLGDTATIPNAVVLDRMRVYLGPFLTAEGLYGQLLGKQAGAVYDAAIKALAALRQPTEAMIDAAAATPGMMACNSAMVLHQVRGYGFDADAFRDGSPLHQAWLAMFDAASRIEARSAGTGNTDPARKGESLTAEGGDANTPSQPSNGDEE